MSTPAQALLDALTPVLERVHALPLDDCDDPQAATALAQRLQQEMPVDGPAFTRVGELVREGVAQGWLCDRGEPSARFSRLAKATPQTRDMSIDVVSLEGPALRHRHPRGEITMAYAADPAQADGRFDGHPPGWVVMPKGSTHTPTVTGSRMLLLYFLPDGACDWNPKD